MEFSRQGYWSGLPFLSLGDLPDPGIESASLAFPSLGFFTAEPLGKPPKHQHLKDNIIQGGQREITFFSFIEQIFIEYLPYAEHSCKCWKYRQKIQTEILVFMELPFYHLYLIIHITCTDQQIHHFASKGLYSQSYGFSSSHVGMWELDHKEGWAPKNWCFQTVMLEKTLQSPLGSVNAKGNQPWIFIEGQMLKINLQYLATWLKEPTHWDPDTGKNWRQEEMGMTEDEMVE